MREARARSPRPSETHDRAANQARLLVEVARRVTEPVESLPEGSRPAVLQGLYRDAIYWALVAEQVGQGGSVPSDPGQAWATAPADRLLKAAGDEGAVGMVRAALVERPAAEALSTTADEIARGRGFAEALLWDLDTAVRAIEHVQVQRWTRIPAALAVLVAAAWGVTSLLRGPNLVATKVFKTSSELPSCTLPNKCGDLFFHTQGQDNPWVDFDLGAAKPVHRIEVTNRSDCCADRAVPLIAEVSMDDKQWIQVARRDSEFSVWKAAFPKQKARYVRFRAPRNTTLHFDDVVIR